MINERFWLLRSKRFILNISKDPDGYTEVEFISHGSNYDSLLSQIIKVTIWLKIYAFTFSVYDHMCHCSDYTMGDN